MAMTTSFQTRFGIRSGRGFRHANMPARLQWQLFNVRVDRAQTKWAMDRVAMDWRRNPFRDSGTPDARPFATTILYRVHSE